MHGAAAHSGTTPIGSRHDAGLVGAEVVVEVRRMCDSGRFGQLRGTVGNFAVEPAQTNVIPSTAVLTVDLRNPDDALMTAAETHLAAFVDDLADRLGLPYIRAMSGAGHDAQELAATCPTAMILVAGEDGGISHTPREYSRRRPARTASTCSPTPC